MGTRLHMNLYIYITTSVPILVLLSQNAQSYPLAAVLHRARDKDSPGCAKIRLASTGFSTVPFAPLGGGKNSNVR